MEQIKQKHFVDTIFHLYEHTPVEVRESYAPKWLELMEKTRDQRLHITFTGHFSAGKSTLLNHLVHGKVLPSSPLPTSSNIVMLAKGPSVVRATDYDGTMYEWKGGAENSFIQTLCKRGDVLHKVYIEHDSFELDNNLVFMDSPGIDSTDDDHRKSTESALHMGDIIVYVTDYHHVQSELNISFIKKLKEMNKELLVIVNQIDKHNEEELPFSQFKERIEDTMVEVGVERDDIFYTTLKALNHPNNELHRFMKKIEQFEKKRQELIEQNIVQSSVQLIKEIAHDTVERFLEKEQVSYEQFQKVEATLDDLKESLEKIDEEIETLNKQKKAIESDYEHELDSLLKNANITPFTVREKAKQFLTTLDPQFKVGLLFSKKKTEAAKKEAYEALLEELNKQIETEIIWHLRNFSKAIYETYELTNGSLLEGILALSYEITLGELQSIVKQGAQLNDQYVLQFAKDVSDYVKRNVKMQAFDILNELIQTKESHQNDKKMSFILKKESLTEQLVVKSKWIEEKEQIEKWQSNMLAALKNGVIYEEFSVQSWLKEKMQERLRLLKENEYPAILTENEMEQQMIEQEEDISSMNSGVQTSATIVNKLHKAVQLLEGLEELTYLKDRLKIRANTIENRSFTIAMFGAFSAGKSSFANALIGERIFPSSPNPTTAVINKLTGITSEFSHGDVQILFKSEQDLLEELNDLLNPHHLHVTELSQLTKVRNELQQNIADSVGKRLDIYEKGIQFLQAQQSKEKITFVEKIEQYVANEEKSCVIQEVTIYYDCELTRKGITLVDTPGASSLHQRHTDLAFQYIKDADAIIFLTYFNHPFSKGDQQFLHQLGLVKDTFTLDKMFFIINAIDLAEDEEEANTVKQYVKQMLLKHSIRNPKLFNVSSLATLNKKELTHVKNEFEPFEQAFAHFIEHDLMEMMVQSASHELQVTINQLKELITLSKLGESERQQKIEALQKAKHSVEQMMKTSNQDDVMIQMKQELQELNHYVKQRLLYRMSDLFKQAYEPSKFVEKNQNTKQILTNCFDEFITTLNTAYVQEFNATSLRIEKYVNGLMERAFSQLITHIEEVIPSIPYSQMEKLQTDTPVLNLQLRSIIPDNMEKGHKYFKNAKAFFEHNEKQKLYLYFEQQLPFIMETMVKKGENLSYPYYEKAFQKQWQKILQVVQSDVEAYVQSRITTLNAPRDVDQLETILKTMEKEVVE
ncbi:dynamin family protein [Bacillus sp. FJAT-47783]|uniref:dynamin family protein n=1 Tax=Bacillus sp. FJAT-47783 TaxID=2922712 RepID=UPI001FAB5086|nr:dynamin family protein [Bacillus sp. FJAT-47783]